MNYRNIIDSSNSIAIISHVNPDADNLGSLTALSESLRLLGKNVQPICIDEIPLNLYYLKGIDKLTNDWEKEYDLLFVLDTSSKDRLGSASGIIEKAKISINIDHHISNNLELDYNIVETTASSTGEVLYKFMRTNNLPLNTDIAESLFTAISADSGSFKYNTVSSETFIIASELLNYNIDRDKINNNLYSSNSMSKIKLLGIAIERMKIVDEFNLAFTYLLDKDFEEYSALNADAEGIVEVLRDIKNIEIAILLRENSQGFKASTRSKNDYNVANLALKFNGGGHLRAAGFTIREKDINSAFNKIIEKI